MIVPITGAEGAPGTVLMFAEVEAVEVQPSALVTVNVYEAPAVSPVTVPVVPELVKEPEGEPVTVHDPEAGNPLRATEPVGVAHVNLGKEERGGH